MTAASECMAKSAPSTEEFPRIHHDERVMGTVVSFDICPGDVPALEVRMGLRRACALFARADAVFSLWKPESPMSRLRRGEIALADTPVEIGEVLELCVQARTLTEGWFDPWAMPGGLDPTGLVKGWAASKALQLLDDLGVDGVMVNAGGDVASSGEPIPGVPWRIGITDPRSRSSLLCAVSSPGAIATSGIYERGSHIIDPFTALPRARWCSATVIGPDLVMADAIATALCAAGAEGAGFVLAARFSAVVVDHAGVARTIGEIDM